MEGWHMLLAVWNGAKPKHFNGGRYQLEKLGLEGLGGTGGGLGGTLGILGISRDTWSQMAQCGMALGAHSPRRQLQCVQGEHGHRHWPLFEGP